MTEDEIHTCMVELPTTIRAYTIALVDGTYCIALNARLDYETLRRAYLHELQHIEAGDFDKFCVSADKIEAATHAGDRNRIRPL